jgi:hypothetical protein
MSKALLRELREEVEKIKKEYNYSHLGHAFVHFCIKYIFDKDDEDAAGYCGIGAFGRDKGIDAIVPDDEEKLLVIISGKYSEKPRKFGRPELVDLQSAISFLSSPPPNIKSPELLRAIQTYKSSIQAGWKIRLALIMFGDLTKDGHEYIDSLKSNLPDNHDIEVYTLKHILDSYVQALGIYSGRGADIELEVEDMLVKEEYNLPRSVLCTVKGSEIARIVNQYRYDIFQLNVRDYLRGTRVNKEIEKTLNDPSERKFFWYYNLGVTAICDKFNTVDKQKIRFENFKIINGCQTASIIAENHDKAADIKVALRVIETKDQELINKITIRNNTQNPIRGRDLFSQHDQQIKIQRYFENRDPPIFYERRAGEWQNLPKHKKLKFKDKSTKKYRKVRNDDCAKAFMAFKLKRPAEAKMKKQYLFVFKDNGGFYEDIFSDNTEPEELLLAYYVHQGIKEKIKEFLRGFESLSENEKSKLELRKSFLPHADTQLLAMFGEIIEMKYGQQYNPRRLQELLMDPQIFSNVYEKLVQVLEIIITQARQISGEASFNPRNYLVNPKTFSIIEGGLQLHKEALLNVLPAL